MQDRLIVIAAIAGLAIVAMALIKWIWSSVLSVMGPVTVYEYQRGLLFSKGKLQKVLEPGKYWLFKPDTYVQMVDIRQWILNVPHQEVLTADNVAVRVSAAAKFQVVDPVLAESKTGSYRDDLYLTFHLMLRELISQVKADDLLLQRNALSDQLLERCKPAALAVGVQVDTAGIKDITFPGELKKVFAQVVQAEKAGQAALTKSRAEVASMRALANAAKMLDGNPNLVTLRTLQSVSELAATSGNTIVFGLPSPMVPISAPGSPPSPPPPPVVGAADDF